MAELELCTSCRNIKCQRVFHLKPVNKEEVELFRELLANRYARPMVWITSRCPACGELSHVLGSTLSHCSCGLPVHSEED